MQKKAEGNSAKLSAGVKFVVVIILSTKLDQLCQRFDGPVHIQQDQAQLGVLMS
jgi:hypothetical protein